MKKIIAFVALLFIAAVLFGCTQQGQQNPPSQQPEGQPQVTFAPVEDIAAQQLESEIPNGNENLTDLNDVLVTLTS
ncbi:hypothetical protein H0N98_03420 [Candidatus Micrarchaeota archaeon]|nr:hypothetical protein [Candidatus Micrarchaeota archaeon]